MSIIKVIPCPQENINVILSQNGANAISRSKFAAIHVRDPRGLDYNYPSFIRPVLTCRFSEFIPDREWTVKYARNNKHITPFTIGEAERIVLFLHALLRAPENFILIISSDYPLVRAASINKFVHFAVELPYKDEAIIRVSQFYIDTLTHVWGQAINGIVRERIQARNASKNSPTSFTGGHSNAAIPQQGGSGGLPNIPEQSPNKTKSIAIHIRRQPDKDSNKI